MVYEIINQAIPDDANTLEVLRAAEIIIADCIIQLNASKENEEKIYKCIVEDIKNMTESFKDFIKKKEEGNE